MQLNKNIIISFLCAFAPLRLGGIKFVRLYEQNNHKNGKNVKKQQKTDYFESTTKPSLFLGEPSFSSTLICKNKPNFPDPGITATPCSSSPYSNLLSELQQKNKPNTNPISTPQNPHFYWEKPHFRETFF